MTQQHYVGTAGLRGYAPNYHEVYDSFEAACESLIDMHDVGWEMLPELGLTLAIEEFEEACANLREFRFSDINLHIHGNQYMQVVSCECGAPWEHSNQPVQEVLAYLGYTEEQVLEALTNEPDEEIQRDLEDYLNSLAEPKEPREEDFPTEADFDLALAQFDDAMYKWLGR